MVRGTPAFTAGGFKIPEGRAWAMVKRVPKSKVWWREIDGWTTAIIAGMFDLWPKATKAAANRLAYLLVAPRTGRASKCGAARRPWASRSRRRHSTC
jgi:hypothetical protein